MESTLDKEVTEIDLLILPDNISAHYDQATDVFSRYSVHETWFHITGEAAADVLKVIDESFAKGKTIRNLVKFPIEHRENMVLENEVVLSFMGLGPGSSGLLMKVQTSRNSILLTSDLVGREVLGDNSQCIGEEAAYVARFGEQLRSEVLVAPSHGANNASSKCFLETVSPSYVIFASGHYRQLPAKRAVDRYLAQGVDIGNMFRTDRGDQEKTEPAVSMEWVEGAGCHDEPGDDDILLHFYGSSRALIGYYNDGFYESCF